METTYILEHILKLVPGIQEHTDYKCAQFGLNENELQRAYVTENYNKLIL